MGKLRFREKKVPSSKLPWLATLKLSSPRCLLISRTLQRTANSCVKLKVTGHKLNNRLRAAGCAEGTGSRGWCVLPGRLGEDQAGPRTCSCRAELLLEADACPQRPRKSLRDSCPGAGGRDSSWDPAKTAAIPTPLFGKKH